MYPSRTLAIRALHNFLSFVAQGNVCSLNILQSLFCNLHKSSYVKVTRCFPATLLISMSCECRIYQTFFLIIWPRLFDCLLFILIFVVAHMLLPRYFHHFSVERYLSCLMSRVDIWGFFSTHCHIEWLISHIISLSLPLLTIFFCLIFSSLAWRHISLLQCFFKIRCHIFSRNSRTSDTKTKIGRKRTGITERTKGQEAFRNRYYLPTEGT